MIGFVDIDSGTAAASTARPLARRRALVGPRAPQRPRLRADRRKELDRSSARPQRLSSRLQCPLPEAVPAARIPRHRPRRRSLSEAARIARQEPGPRARRLGALPEALPAPPRVPVRPTRSPRGPTRRPLDRRHQPAPGREVGMNQARVACAPTGDRFASESPSGFASERGIDFAGMRGLLPGRPGCVQGRGRRNGCGRASCSRPTRCDRRVSSSHSSAATRLTGPPYRLVRRVLQLRAKSAASGEGRRTLERSELGRPSKADKGLCVQVDRLLQSMIASDWSALRFVATRSTKRGPLGGSRSGGWISHWQCRASNRPLSHS